LRGIETESVESIAFFSAERLGRVVKNDTFVGLRRRVRVVWSELVRDVLVSGPDCRVGKLQVRREIGRGCTIGMVSVKLLGGVVKMLLSLGTLPDDVL
jgi:hypothetical protein